MKFVDDEGSIIVPKSVRPIIDYPETVLGDRCGAFDILFSSIFMLLGVFLCLSSPSFVDIQPYVNFKISYLSH
ncbi:MAG: hypothetical protein ACRD47_06995, partial [Nitrososphaeraceae archaeon]